MATAEFVGQENIIIACGSVEPHFLSLMLDRRQGFSLKGNEY
jgi:hypothetical protein